MVERSVPRAALAGGSERAYEAGGSANANEELSVDPSASRAGLRLPRYLHAIRDIERGVFSHCDGAVRAYTYEQCEARAAKGLCDGP